MGGKFSKANDNKEFVVPWDTLEDVDCDFDFLLETDTDTNNIINNSIDETTKQLRPPFKTHQEIVETSQGSSKKRKFPWEMIITTPKIARKGRKRHCHHNHNHPSEQQTSTSTSTSTSSLSSTVKTTIDYDDCYDDCQELLTAASTNSSSMGLDSIDCDEQQHQSATKRFFAFDDYNNDDNNDDDAFATTAHRRNFSSSFSSSGFRKRHRAHNLRKPRQHQHQHQQHHLREQQSNQHHEHHEHQPEPSYWNRPRWKSRPLVRRRGRKPSTTGGLGATERKYSSPCSSTSTSPPPSPFGDQPKTKGLGWESSPPHSSQPQQGW